MKKVDDLSGIDLCLWHNRAMIKSFLEKEQQRKIEKEEEMRERVRQAFGEEIDEESFVS